MAITSFDKLIIDRVVDGWFETKSEDPKLIAVLDQLQNLSINTSSETKDKTDAQGALIKRYFTAKSVEITGENAIFSLNLAALQSGSDKKAGAEVVMPRIMQFAKPASGTFSVELPDTPEEGTLFVYATSENGLVDTSKQYTKATTAAADKYAITTSDNVTTITMPINATDTVQVKYEYKVKAEDVAERVDVTGDGFPKECKATFRVLCSDICDSETVRALYIVFPKFQMSPDNDLSLTTDATQSFTATAMKDYCGKGQILYYIAIAEDSDEYDTKQFD